MLLLSSRYLRIAEFYSRKLRKHAARAQGYSSTPSTVERDRRKWKRKKSSIRLRSPLANFKFSKHSSSTLIRLLATGLKWPLARLARPLPRSRHGFVEFPESVSNRRCKWFRKAAKKQCDIVRRPSVLPSPLCCLYKQLLPR